MSEYMRKVCGVLSLIIVVAMLLNAIFGSPIAIYQTKRDVQNYLNGCGIAKEDILSLEGCYTPSNEAGTKYYAEVILKAQPDEVLIFQYDPIGNIIQAGH